MSTYTVVKQDDATYAVCDDVGFVMDTFSNTEDAKLFVKDLTAIDAHSLYIAQTQWVEPTIEVDVADEPKPKPTEPVVECKKLVADAASMKKSDRVRARIADAKANNETADVVVEWVIATLGMNKPLAKTYVKGNWNKV